MLPARRSGDSDLDAAEQSVVVRRATEQGLYERIAVEIPRSRQAHIAVGVAHAQAQSASSLTATPTFAPCTESE